MAEELDRAKIMREWREVRDESLKSGCEPTKELLERMDRLDKIIESDGFLHCWRAEL